MSLLFRQSLSLGSNMGRFCTLTEILEVLIEPITLCPCH